MKALEKLGFKVGMIHLVITQALCLGNPHKGRIYKPPIPQVQNLHKLSVCIVSPMIPWVFSFRTHYEPHHTSGHFKAV